MEAQASLISLVRCLGGTPSFVPLFPSMSRQAATLVLTFAEGQTLTPTCSLSRDTWKSVQH